jgi:hypothetical protein
MRHLYTLLFLAVAVAMQAQISFSNQTSLLGQGSFYSGVAVGIADMNGDGLDDVVRLGNGSNLSVEYQSLPNGNFANYTYGNVPDDAWAMVLGDVNNDGWNDILVGGYYDGVKVLMGNGSSFTSTLLPVPPVGNTFVQGSNFADINNDGWLDVFTCHDDGVPRIWGNDGAGGFAYAGNWINMATVPASDNSGNYGSIWTDFDNDRDLDLYVAKCRQGVTNESDPRRINTLFVNDGQNHYTEEAGKHGLKIQWQSWTSDFQDIDNDGDLDALVTNHDHPLMLLENDGRGNFTDIAAAAGVAVTGNFIQGIMRDFDNDGFVDILTVGNFSSTTLATYLFHNNGDQTFTQVISPFGSASIGSVAVGDLNNDGLLDLYASYMTSFNNPSNSADKLWMNTTSNGNNHFAVNLHGTVSNRMGVGARVELHGDWGIQIREVHAGESYGIQNSLTQYFGLGSSTAVEYVAVHWPSGIVDVVKNPDINTSLTITEGSTCSLPGFDLGTSGAAVLCPGESLTLSAPAGYEYLWSNGMVGQNIEVTEPGNYSVVAVDAQGCAAVSSVLAVSVNPDETPTLTLDGDDKFCEGGSAVLSSSPAMSYAWPNGETTQSIVVDQTGDYAVTIEGACGNFTSQAIHVEVLSAPVPVASDVHIPAPGPATLEAVGENLFWYDSPSATTPLFNGPSFVTPAVASTATYYVEDAHAYGGGDYATGMPQQQGSNLFNGDNFNGQTNFEVYQPMTLNQVTLNTDKAGVRLIELIQEPDLVVASKAFDLPVGQTIADLDFVVQPGTYRLATNSDTNLSSLGTLSPRLYRSNAGVAYPYTVPGLMSITNSDLGSGFYYYFFDWKVSAVPQVCVSERIPVTVTVDPSAAGEVFAFGKIAVQPNPSDGKFMLFLEPAQGGRVDLQVTDLAGRVVFKEKMVAVGQVAQQMPIDLTGAAPGLYVLKITDGETSGCLKIVVQ